MRDFNEAEFFIYDKTIYTNGKEMELTVADRANFLYISSKTSPNNGEAYVQKKDFKERFNFGSKTVDRSIERLSNAGLVEPTKAKNVYRVVGRMGMKQNFGMMHYEVINSLKLNKDLTVVYGMLSAWRKKEKTTQVINGLEVDVVQEVAKISVRDLASKCGFSDNKEFRYLLDELVNLGLILWVKPAKVFKGKFQHAKSVFVMRNLTQVFLNEDVNEQEKNSEAANNGEELVSNQINTTEIINENYDFSEKNLKNIAETVASRYLEITKEEYEFEPTPSYEELGEDVDGFLKDLDPVEEYDEYEEDEDDMGEVNTVDMFLNDISGTKDVVKEEEPVHIPSPAVKTTYTSILGKSVEEVIQESNKKVLDYQDNKRTTLTKEDKTISMDEIYKMFG